MGKSSLINGLIGSPQAKTSHKPGYTRTINFFELGKALSLVDLPGYVCDSTFNLRRSFSILLSLCPQQIQL